MSLFENDRYHWRETYFIQFPAKNRPLLDKVRQALSMMREDLELVNATADAQGRFESITILSPDDFAAVDVSFLGGVEVLEQANETAKELTATCDEEDTQKEIQKLRHYDGRFDVLHFEQVADDDGSGEEQDGMLNPSTLLLVLDCLAQLTGGLAIDPQTGTVV